MDNTRTLVQILRERQVELGESDPVFARRLNVNRETWRLLRTGGSQPGRKVIRGAGQAFPDLQLEIAGSLFLSVDMGKPNLKSGISNEHVEASR